MRTTVKQLLQNPLSALTPNADTLVLTALSACRMDAATILHTPLHGIAQLQWRAHTTLPKAL